MNRATLALLAGLAAALSTGPSLAEPAEPPIANPGAIVDNLTADNVSELIRELGGQQIQTREVDGKKLVTFMDGNVPYNLGIALCDIRPGKCLAVAIAVIIDPGTTSYPLEIFNNFNKENLFVTLIKLEGNKFGVGRVLLVDGGVTKKNLAINIASFALTFQEAMKYLSSQLVAGYQQNGTFQRAGLGAASPRPVFATPQEMTRIMDAMAKQYKTTLGPRR